MYIYIFLTSIYHEYDDIITSIVSVSFLVKKNRKILVKSQFLTSSDNESAIIYQALAWSVSANKRSNFDLYWFGIQWNRIDLTTL